MDISRIRKDFPFFEQNKDNVYLDNAATSQKPKSIIESQIEYYTYFNANANRGIYSLSMKSTEILEYSRKKIAKFINAESEKNIVFTKSATEALNIVAYTYGLNNLKKGDEILISIAEHHANLVSWQYVAKKTGAKLVYFYLDKDLNLDIEDYKSKLTENTKIVAFTGASNVLSFNVNIQEMVKMAKKVGAITVVDGAQLISHKKVDVEEMGCDFFAFSGHKMYSLQGVGVLYGKRTLLNEMPPFLYGGDIVEYVNEQDTSFTTIPNKFEAGTQNIGAIFSLSKAIDYIENIGMENIEKREKELTNYLLEKLNELNFVTLYYSKSGDGTNISFNVNNVHPHDVAQILDYYNIDIRVGHHCAQPLHRYLGLNSSCRASIAFYNTFEEIDKFIDSLYKVKEVFYGN